jgi:predicted NAD/FAD-binding protein
VRIAIVGTGVSGLTCAHVLAPVHEVTVFEADDRPGGHANTVRIDLADETHEVDTGFIVFNEPTYPGFNQLLGELGVDSAPTDMSFSVTDERTGVVWNGSSVGSVFAQRANTVRPGFWRMLRDVARFNRRARAILDAPVECELTLEELLADGPWSREFLDWYLVPLGAAVWSADPTTFTRFPAAAFARFFDNHGMLQLRDRIPWRTVPGGARRYVDAISHHLGPRLRVATPIDKIVRRDDHVELRPTAGEPETFDHVIVATHSDQALALLADPSRAEREILGAIRYQPNTAVLHTDAGMLPPLRRAWASWNFQRPVDARRVATVTYHMNRLQNLESRHEICLTLNRTDEIRPDAILAAIEYAHPVFDREAMRAQQRHAEISHRDRTSYCGAYWGYGFHEDGVTSARRVCADLGVPW